MPPALPVLTGGIASHATHVAVPVLSMAGRRDLLLAPKIEDLRRKVFEPAAIIGEPGAHDPNT
jgi:hypothetical protein